MINYILGIGLFMLAIAYGILYVASIVCACEYFENKYNYEKRIIFFIASITPIWNTYFAFKECKIDFKKEIKRQFSFRK